jgi:hypothetical protein
MTVIFLIITIYTGYRSSSAPGPMGSKSNIIWDANKIPVKPKSKYVEVALLLIVFLEPLCLATHLGWMTGKLGLYGSHGQRFFYPV